MLLPDFRIRELCEKRGEYPGTTHQYWTEKWLNVGKIWQELQFLVSCPKPMISPFSEAVSGNGVISSGVTHAGYDIHLGNTIKILKPNSRESINPKRMKDPDYVSRMFDTITFPEGSEGKEFVIPPHGSILGTSLETFCIPRNVVGRCLGKSTLARSFIIINVTPLEPAWEGKLTVEISNLSSSPASVFIGEGIAQIQFELLTDEPDNDYSQKGGVYQHQTDTTVARVKE